MAVCRVLEGVLEPPAPPEPASVPPVGVQSSFDYLGVHGKVRKLNFPVLGVHRVLILFLRELHQGHLHQLSGPGCPSNFVGGGSCHPWWSFDYSALLANCVYVPPGCFCFFSVQLLMSSSASLVECRPLPCFLLFLGRWPPWRLAPSFFAVSPRAPAPPVETLSFSLGRQSPTPMLRNRSRCCGFSTSSLSTGIAGSTPLSS